MSVKYQLVSDISRRLVSQHVHVCCAVDHNSPALLVIRYCQFKGLELAASFIAFCGQLHMLQALRHEVTMFIRCHVLMFLSTSLLTYHLQANCSVLASATTPTLNL